MNIRNIPTEEDFARARAAMQRRDHGLSEARSTILNRFVADGLHQVFILYSADIDQLVVYLFFSNKKGQIASEQSGLTEQIKTYVLDELVRVRRREKVALNVVFEIDNDENVQREYNGDYYGRLS